MDTTELEYFVTVAQCKNFSKAAELLFTSQSNISYHIRHLENELGFLLFEPNNRVALTPSGRVIFDRAVQYNEIWKKTVYEAQTLSDRQRKNIHVGIRRLMDENKLVELLKRFYTSQNEYGFVLHMYRLGYFVQDLIRGNRDILFAAQCEVEYSPGIGYLPLFPCSWGYAINKNHTLSSKKVISFSDLNGERIILPEVPPGAEEGPHSLAVKRNCMPLEILYSSNHEHAVLCAAAGVAISAVNYAIPSTTDNVTFIPAEGFENTNSGLAWRTADVSPGISLFLNIAKEVFSGV